MLRGFPLLFLPRPSLLPRGGSPQPACPRPSGAPAACPAPAGGYRTAGPPVCAAFKLGRLVRALLTFAPSAASAQPHKTAGMRVDAPGAGWKGTLFSYQIPDLHNTSVAPLQTGFRYLFFFLIFIGGETGPSARECVCSDPPLAARWLGRRARHRGAPGSKFWTSDASHVPSAGPSVAP